MRVRSSAEKQRLYLIVLLTVQAACIIFFALDVFQEYSGGSASSVIHTVMELLATLSLVGAVVLELCLLRHLLRIQARSERSLKVARGQMHDVLEGYFREWGLTPAEADVASMTIKGFSISEICELRSAREGTVKTQLTSIYRKAGVAGRSQLGSLLIEDLMGAPLAS
jgi:DNA-binding CsgD family transcriptional regulator